MRIARFTTGDDPQYGVVTGELDQFGQPSEDARVVALAGDPLYVGLKLLEEEHRLEDVRLLAPVAPTKVVAIGRNYAAHARELGHEVPSEPLMFLKAPSAIVGPNAAIRLPSLSSRVDHEAELAVVIGKRCKRVDESRAHEVIFGYMPLNDVTARDLQRKDVQFTRAKGFDTFCPVGPWIETELDPRDLARSAGGSTAGAAGR